MCVDIEDEADALAPFDQGVEDFPAVLVAHGEELRILGTLTPHAATLTETIDAACSAVQPGLEVAKGGALAAVLRSIGRLVV